MYVAHTSSTPNIRAEMQGSFHKGPNMSTLIKPKTKMEMPENQMLQKNTTKMLRINHSINIINIRVKPNVYVE